MKIVKKILGWGLAGLVLLVGVGIAAVYIASERKLRQAWPVPAVSIAVPTDAASIAEGKRLATLRGCWGACHGKAGEGSVMFDQPMIARITAPNLTLAAAQYDAGQLAAIIRNGVRPDGQSMVVMPSEAWVGVSDEDLGKIVAFLKSLPRDERVPPETRFGPLGRIGLATGKFKTAAQLIADARPAAPAKSEATKPGHYLATTICTQCHGTNLMGWETPSFAAPGLVMVLAYSLPEFTALMREGRAVGGRELAMMGPYSRRHYSVLTDEEISALYGYLRQPR